MIVTTKSDVYSFGVVALEVMMGKHPMDLLEAVSASAKTLPNNSELLLKDLLDKRLPSPTDELAEAVVFVVRAALACTRANPESRPNMRFVAQELSARTQPSLSEPFDMITIDKLTSFQK